MTKDMSITLTISFKDADLEEEDLDNEAQNLLNQLKEIDEVESVRRVLDPNPPVNSKSLGGVLVGVLTAEVSPANVKNLLIFLRERLGGKPIELTVEANGRKLSVKASSREELEYAIKSAQDFIDRK